MTFAKPEQTEWQLWVKESRRSEHPRSRFYHIKYSRYPQNAFWLRDMAIDAAKTGAFRYDLHTRKFDLILRQTAPKKRYGGKEIRVWLKVRIRPDGEVEFPSDPQFFGADAKLASYEWRYGSDPLKMPRLPLLFPGSPDILKSSLFSGPGVIHKQYPKVYYPKKLSVPVFHQHPHASSHWYGNPETRRTGLPSALPKFSTAGRTRSIKPRKVRREEPTY